MEARLKRKRVVVSAINFTEGGPLTVLLDCLSSAAQSLSPEWEIIALIHDQKLVNQQRARLIEVPDAKRSWLRRLYHEWFTFGRLSREIQPDLWLSLHDITPRVTASRQAVYCHNPAPFYCLSLREAWLEPNFFLFNHFYRYLYRAFIRRNHLVVVQQVWLRDAFKHMYGHLPIVVAHPLVNLPVYSEYKESSEEKVIFFYPALPRVFKNFEVICKAVQLLNIRGVSKFEVRLTLDGTENRYSHWLHSKYKNLTCLQFVGLQNKAQMHEQYEAATAVIFPSKLETWGIPISEAKFYNKSLLVADMPYAHETVGNYDKVSFFPATDEVALANLIQVIIERSWKPNGARTDEPSQPYAHNWDELWGLLTEGL